MIELKNVSKIYYTKAKQQRLALEDVNLIFPDTGMIFVTGKSGSATKTFNPASSAPTRSRAKRDAAAHMPFEP